MAGANTKLFYANIQLINSVIKDGVGNIISLTSDERLAVSNASSGPATQENPLTTKNYVDEAINSAVTSAIDGLSWRPPVNTVSATEPELEEFEEGYRYLNTTDNKIYTYKSGSFDSGVTPQANWAVYVKDTDEEFTYNEEEETWVMKSSGAIPDATKEMKGKVVIGNNIDVVNGSISVKDASTEDKGVVELAENGEVAALKVVQSNDSRLLKGRFTGTYTGVTNFEVNHQLGSKKLIVQIWDDGELVDAYVALKSGDEFNTVQIGLNQSSTVDVVVIAVP
jgi:hypothetical protein